MRELPAQTCPLTVVVWDSDSLPDESRVSSLEAGLVIKLPDLFPWKCNNEEDVVILTAYKKHARLLMKHLGNKKGKVLVLMLLRALRSTVVYSLVVVMMEALAF